MYILTVLCIYYQLYVNTNSHMYILTVLRIYYQLYVYTNRSMYRDGQQDVDEYIAEKHKTNGIDHHFTTSAGQP